MDMIAASRLLLEAAHGTNDPAVLAAKAKGPGSVTEDQVRDIARAKLPDLRTDNLDQGVTLVKGLAEKMRIQVR